ncbi:MAG: hypothetical protein ACTS6A_00435 [Candidatus Hodgkinia cicadicola]
MNVRKCLRSVTVDLVQLTQNGRLGPFHFVRTTASVVLIEDNVLIKRSFDFIELNESLIPLKILSSAVEWTINLSRLSVSRTNHVGSRLDSCNVTKLAQAPSAVKPQLFARTTILVFQNKLQLTLCTFHLTSTSVVLPTLNGLNLNFTPEVSVQLISVPFNFENVFIAIAFQESSFPFGRNLSSFAPTTEVKSKTTETRFGTTRRNAPSALLLK